MEKRDTKTGIKNTTWTKKPKIPSSPSLMESRHTKTRKITTTTNKTKTWHEKTTGLLLSPSVMESICTQMTTQHKYYSSWIVALCPLRHWRTVDTQQKRHHATKIWFGFNCDIVSTPSLTESRYPCNTHEYYSSSSVCAVSSPSLTDSRCATHHKYYYSSWIVAGAASSPSLTDSRCTTHHKYYYSGWIVALRPLRHWRTVDTQQTMTWCNKNMIRIWLWRCVCSVTDGEQIRMRHTCILFKFICLCCVLSIPDGQ